MSKLSLRKTDSLNRHLLNNLLIYVFLKNVIQYIASYHNVAAIINDITYALYTGWVAKLNFQVSLPNELSAEVVIASSFL